MSTDAPAFDFYPERWLAGVIEMSDGEQLAFFRLLCLSWLKDGLPDDDKALRRMGGRGFSAAVRAKFVRDSEGKLRNERLEIVRTEQRARIAASRSKIEKMNAARLSCNGSTRGPTRGPTSDSEMPISDVLSASSPLTPHPSPPNSITPLSPKGKGGLEYSEDFEKFWSEYPRKTGKGGAFNAWKKSRTKPGLEIILSALDNHNRSSDWAKNNGQYIPCPSKWINERRWDDELPQISQPEWEPATGV